MLFDVTVGFTTARPVQPDAQFAFFQIDAQNDLDAGFVAIAMLMATRPSVQMPTSTRAVKKS